ncbi:MAG: penicillin-binding transpeptidase domain-containing protein [Clostridiales bacterium]
MSKKEAVKAERPTQMVNKRLMLVYALIIVIFVVLIGRLFTMQIVQGADYAVKATNNIDRVVNIPARRGVIYDKNGNILASSEPIMSVNVYMDEVKDGEELAKNLSALFNRKDIFEAEEEARSVIGQSTVAEAVEKNQELLLQAKKAEAAKKGETIDGKPLAEAANGETVDGETADGETTDGKTTDENTTDTKKAKNKKLGTIKNADGTISKNEKVTPKEIEDMLPSSGNNYKPVSVRSYTYDVGIKVAQIVAENKDQYPGVYVVEEAMRTYPFGFYLGQTLGTVGKISEKQLEEEKDLYGYELTDTVGKSGLESYYEHYTKDGKEMGLRGQDGKRYLEVDARGNISSVISEEPPISGNSLKLAIDLNTQKYMEDALQEVIASAGNAKCKAGSAVVLDVHTGGVIAMASAPSVDPNDFVRGLTQEEVDYYFDSKLKPQMNRTISGQYAPGSTFKLVCATALLKAGIPVTDSVACTGPTNAVKPMAGCWDSHGTVNFFTATAGSCNTYFQTMAARIGEDKLLDAGRKYGFGQLTNIDLPGEVAGVLPSPQLKAEKNSGWESQWQIYDTYYTAMGQGANADTVLQLASYAATLANGGARMQPHLVDEIVDDKGNVLVSNEPTEVDNLKLTDEIRKNITQAMKDVVSGEGGGTASNLFKGLPLELQPAGKTGTAQTGLAEDNNDSDYHGVFIAFAPADDPQIAYAGLVEYGQHGGPTAGKVCEAAFEAYFGYKVDYDLIVSENVKSNKDAGSENKTDADLKNTDSESNNAGAESNNG